MYIGASAWVKMDDTRQGLWEECITASPGRVQCDPMSPPGETLIHKKRIDLNSNSYM